MKKRVILPVINDLTIDQRMHKICTTLYELGFEVLLVGAKRKTSVPLLPRIYETDRFSLIFEKGKIFYLEFNIRLFFYLLFHKADIITANDLDTLLPSYLVSKIKGAELIYDSHEYFTEMPELDGRPVTKKIWLTLEKWLFVKPQKIMTVNNSIAKIYSDLYKKDIHVVRNVPFRVDNVPELTKQNIVIYQGNINKSRGIEIMLEALTMLDNVIFWCVGPGDLLSEMQELSIKLNVAHKVRFWGAVPFHNLRELTLQAKIGISIEQPIGLNSKLCLPNKLMDYIQSRVPVIVSNLPEMAQLVKQYETGIILADYNARVLADTIKSMIDSPELLEKYSKNCEFASKELCWEQEKKVLTKIYS